MPASTNASKSSAPVITVVGKLDAKFLVRTSWGDNTQLLTASERTLSQVKTLGIEVVDDPANYLVKQ